MYKKISWNFSHQVKNADGLRYVVIKSIHPFNSDNESYPTEETDLIKYISHLNESPYKSIPDNGDGELPKFNLYRIWNSQKWCNLESSAISLLHWNNMSNLHYVTPGGGRRWSFQNNGFMCTQQSVQPKGFIHWIFLLSLSHTTA